MQRIIGIILLIFIFSCNRKTQQLSVSVPPDTYEQPENALLWKISGKKLEKPSYLFGTIHLINKEDFFLTDATRESFDHSEKVVFEINMEEMSDFSTLVPVMMKIFMANNTTLKDLVNEEEYSMIKDHFKDLGLPMILLNRVKPMILSIFDSQGDLFSGEQQTETLSYEMELMEMAKEGQKEMGGLETAAYQMSMFDSIPYKAQADMLVQSIKNPITENNELKFMTELYTNQDIEGMQQMIKADTLGISSFEEILLIQRNKNWIPLMDSMMLQKPTFFAVGAGHLGGRYGVITLLKEVGYELTPLKEE